MLLDDFWTPGSKLSEAGLARELNMSRTPVREAIRRLQSQGLLRHVPSKGVYVTQPDRDEVMATFEVRKAMECMAVRKAARMMDIRQQRKLLSLCEQMRNAIHTMRDSRSDILEGEPLRQYLAADLTFHMVILSAARNPLALKIVADSHVRNRVFGCYSHRRDLHNVAWAWLVHARIARALRRRDARAAKHWMSKHISNSCRAALTSQGASMFVKPRYSQAESDISELLNTVAQHLLSVPDRNTSSSKENSL